MTHRHESGFRDVTRLAEARATLRELIDPHGRTRDVPIGDDAVGERLADAVVAQRDVPHYDRAAMDGFAVRSEETHGADDRSPATLRVASSDPVSPGEAKRVHTGSELPDGADAVVMVERARTVGDRIEVTAAVAEGENVAPAGEDVAAGRRLLDAGDRLRPSDLGLLRSAGVDAVTVADPPRVSVVPTGDELVDDDPNPGEIVETNGLVVSALARRWGAETTHRDVVPDDGDALAAAIDRGSDHDLVVTTGGSSVGERDLLPEVVADRGELAVHGVAVKPGHPVGFGAVDGTPILILPGYPVSCLVNAVQLLRPAIAWAGGGEPRPLPATSARLDRKVPSEPGVRTFARVRLDRSGADGDRLPAAEPIRADGAGVLSSVTDADGWVVVPEEREGYAADDTVNVERWE